MRLMSSLKIGNGCHALPAIIERRACGLWACQPIFADFHAERLIQHENVHYQTVGVFQPDEFSLDSRQWSFYDKDPFPLVNIVVPLEI